MNPPIQSLAVAPRAGGGTELFAGCMGGVFKSTDDGTTWVYSRNGITFPAILSMAVSTNAGGATTIFAAGDSGVYRSTDDGANWNDVSSGMASHYVFSLAVEGNGTNAPILYAGTYTAGVFCSTDNGDTWTSVSEGLGDKWVWSLHVGSKFLFAGTQGGGVWRRPLSELTGVARQESARATRFVLGQNYPNPFNPTTTIAFSVPTRSYVTLKIFDFLGREVATLASSILAEGNYTRQWDAGGLASGVYFCRLRAGSFSETKKLVLLR